MFYGQSDEVGSADKTSIKFPEVKDKVQYLPCDPSLLTMWS